MNVRNPSSGTSVGGYEEWGGGKPLVRWSPELVARVVGGMAVRVAVVGGRAAGGEAGGESGGDPSGGGKSVSGGGGMSGGSGGDSKNWIFDAIGR